MNNSSPNTNREAPKTPGGISKSLLTPCRRVGLSRKWRKSGCSPFISPLSGQNTTPERTPAQGEKKRKISEELQLINNESATDQFEISHNSSLNSPTSSNAGNENNDIISTPCRNTLLPRKKSKTLTLSLKNNHETAHDDLSVTNKSKHKPLQPDESYKNDLNVLENKNHSKEERNNMDVITARKQNSIEKVQKPVRTDSKSKLSLKRSHSKCDNSSKSKEALSLHLDNNDSKKISPNKLAKECIVVIQKKIMNTDQDITPSKGTENDTQDVDSEPDVPLSEIKKENLKPMTLNTLDDDKFSELVKKPIRSLSIKRNKGELGKNDSSSSSQSSQDSIGKTIIVKKTYDKVIKPLKAKSTGSITQKDVDELKARIELKKKLLLAKAMSVDTEELRSLIKKWQKGCQDALMELLDLMKKKLPERQNMNYSEILTTLKIPAELVGYDSENECFVTPDDTNMILNAFKL